MPELFIYLIKVNVALLVFCLGYYLVLRRLTFYTLNRVYLVTAIIFSTLYPRIDLTNFMNRHEQISGQMQVIVVNWQGQVNDFAQTATQYNKWFWLQCIFWVGVAFLAIRLLVQLVSLYKLHRRSEPAQVHKYLVRTISGNINPFSFWRNIYLNPENHSAAELRAILEHEQIHVNEWHTLDILLGEISTIFYWFNPGIWLMKRAIRENIEFITDRKILQKGMDSKAYQYSLLNVNFGAQHNTIVNHFNISTIKKRIIMMNAKRSSRINITRYVFLVPVVVLLLLVFSVSKAQLVKAAKSTRQAVASIKTAVAEKIDDIAAPAKDSETRNAEPLTATATNAIADTSKKVKVFILDEPAEFVHSLNDTNKRTMIKIKSFGGDDSRVFIDGKEVQKAHLDSLHGNDIQHINVLKNNKKTGNEQKAEGFIFITTKAPGANKKTQDMMNQLHFDTRLIVDSLRKTMGTSVRINGNDGLGIIKGKVNGVEITTPAEARKLVGTIIVRDGKTIDSSIVISGNGRYTFSTGINRSINRSDSANKEVVVIGYARPKTGLTGVQINGSNKFSGLDSLLKIVDGKIVNEKELKKVSAADIESIQIFKGDDAVKKYGDKGKKGVIVLTTKK